MRRQFPLHPLDHVRQADLGLGYLHPAHPRKLQQIVHQCAHLRRRIRQHVQVVASFFVKAAAQMGLQ